MSDYDLALEGYDSYDQDLIDNLLREDDDHWPPEPRQVRTPARREPAPVKRIEVGPVKGPGRQGPEVVPKLKLGLEDVEEEEPLMLQQTGNTTGYFLLLHSLC